MQEQIIQKKLEKTLAHYVAMPTIPADIPACSAAIKTLSTELEKLGMFVRIDGPMHPWLIATTTQQALTKKHVKILFVIHFDIVAPTNEGQLSMRATKDKLYGRGVYDMKFAAACVKELIKTYAQQGDLQAYDFGVLITTDEEKGGYDGALDFLQRGWTCDLAIVPDGGGNWKIENRSKGMAYLYLQANGKSAHSSRPWEGDNPIPKLAPAIQEIALRFTNTDPNAVTVSINSIETSDSAILNTTKIPEWAKIGMSIRAFDNHETDKTLNFVRAIAKKYNLELHITLHDSSVHLRHDNKLIQEYIRVLEQQRGEPVEYVDALGASDARHFAQSNIPSVVMYISGGGFHGPEEWITRSDLYRYYHFIDTFLRNTAYQSLHAARTPTINFADRYKRLLRPLIKAR